MQHSVILPFNLPDPDFAAIAMVVDLARAQIFPFEFDWTHGLFFHQSALPERPL